MIRRLTTLAAGLVAICFAVALAPSMPAKAQAKKIVLATPGIPPIFAAVNVYVAQKEGFFSKYGANVEIRPFDNGTAAARAVIAGDIDIAMSPTPPVINQVANAGVPLVAIYGMNNPDWILATTGTGNSCNDVAGQAVGVDSIGGARSVALRSMLVGCPGVTIDQVHQVALGSNTAPAMIAGQLSFGVLHLDDVAVIETQGKKLSTLLAMKNTNPTSHYVLYVVRRDRLAANRDTFVRTIAALIAANRFMQDSGNADAVAQAATITGHDANVSKAALKEFLAISFWPTDDDGMDRTKITAVSALMKKIGAIQPDKQPAPYDELVDASIWRDANAMVK
ncbi:MAG TPA: ABC transporter substrate-binding protein [Xanthobacteraceae bacterium]|jgi:ABC-type nitrate/sulfonate/bicarbonate transport system substrate-binding protein